MKQKYFLIFIYLIITSLSNSVFSQQLAFPTAEGFGRFTQCARAATTRSIYHVTNLNDSGSGSFRDAVSQPGRIVVFDVSGVIKLNSRIVFSGNSYIAGQTAPGDGIILYGNGVSFSGANNLIVRYLRIYMGKGGESGKDASGVANGTNMIFDHLSILWGLDETFSVNWDNKGTEPGNITIQKSIIGQGIQTHSAGGLIQTNGGVSIIKCLYIDNKTRNPKIKGLNQFINNIVYNWNGSNGYIMGDTSADSWNWCEGNYFISGPNSGSSPFERATSAFQIFTNSNNNKVDGNKNGTLDGAATTNSSYGSATQKTSVTGFTSTIPQPFPAIAAGILTPEQALTAAINSVGASLPVRSQPDAYVINQLLSYGTKGALITNESANKIYNNVGVVSVGTKPTDTDNDGMPDAWETANGLNPNSAADALLTAANGYLNIENYLNSITEPVNPYIRTASNFEMTARTTSSIDIKWVNHYAGDNIILQISTTGTATSFTDLVTLPATATTYSAGGLNEDTPYYFRTITTKAGLTNSTPSEILKVATAGTPAVPHASINPSPAVGETSRFYTEVIFSWENETGPWAGDVTYKVFFGNSASNLAQIATGLSNTTYTHSNAGMTMGNTYYWRVDATNTLGTTQSAVWSFTAGTFSFVSSYVDAGTDFVGSAGSGTKVTASSGVTFGSGKNYTIKAGTADEMKVTVTTSEAMNNSNNNVYNTSGSVYAAYITADGTATSNFVEMSLVAGSQAKNISFIKLNGTSASVDAGGVAHVLFSDKVPFNVNSIIWYEEVEYPMCRKGENAIEVQAAVGSKSFRVYRTVTLSTVDEDLYRIGGNVNPFTLTGSGSFRIAYIGATLELVSDDSGTPQLSSDNKIASATIGGLTAIINNTAGTITARLPEGTAINNLPITFTLSSAAANADFTSGNTHNFENGALSITVTAENEDTKTYTVTVTVATAKTIGLLTVNGQAAAYDNLLLSAFTDYDVTFLNAADATPADISTYYQNYDLIVLHSHVGGTNPIGLATKALVGVKPILNLKAFFYSNNRWSWSTPNNTEIGRT
ncbi:MAG: thrombospondin type 3 repeat-containing protein, partial [Paludibacter sp.]|nr:thrombospondin type 3 repeat-containing protein [Paludibacter sp.]